jgi:biopolymer transport protein ExbD
MRKMRKFSVKPQGRPNSDINVTPLVDVVLVLLIIFMVVTPLLEKMLRVRVPDAEQSEQQEMPPSAQLVVSLDSQGQIAINSEKVGDAEFPEKLKRFLAARPPGDRLVFFTADDAAKYPRLVVALDGARQAGAEILTMTTEPMAAAGTAVAAPAGDAAPAPK